MSTFALQVHIVPDLTNIMCATTYVDTICIHPLKSAYSLLKMRTHQVVSFQLRIFYFLSSLNKQNLLAT